METPAAPENTGTENDATPHYPLRQLYFYLTEGCNLACRHCWLAPQHDPRGDRCPTLPVETFRRAVAEALPLGLEGVKLTGGEPLLHPRISILLDIVQDAGVNLTIETNGVLLTPALARRIAAFPARMVSVSLDGADAATHDRIRGVPGSFDKACTAVRLLAETGTAPQIIMSLMDANWDQVEAMIGLADILGADSLKVNLIQPSGRGKKLQTDTSRLTIERLIALGYRVVMDLAPETPLELFFDLPLAFRPLSRIAQGNGCGVCGILSILGVLAEGQWALCGIGHHVPELAFGCVGRHNLEAVWQRNPILQQLRAGLPDRLRGVCASCIMKKSCNAACIAQNYFRTRSLWAPYWFCEEARLQGLFPSTRLL